MNILVLARSFPTMRYPLQGIFEFDQTKALASLGNNVIVLAIDLRSIRRFRKFGLSVFKENGVTVYLYNFPLGAIPASCLAFFSKLFATILMKKIIKKEGIPDIIHAHFCFLQGYYGAKISKKYQIPLVITEHSSNLMYNYTQKFDKYFKYGYNNASGIICVSKALKDAIKEHFGYDSYVIPNIVDLNEFKYSKKTVKDYYTFVSVGNLIYSKGFDILLQAFSRIREENVILHIIGDGKERKKLENLSIELGISERVYFFGRQNRDFIASHLQKGDCFVLPSRSETFGVVYIESLATGTPIIATNCGGPSDIITEKNGLLVSVDNIDELVLAMRKMIQNSFNYEHDKISIETSMMYSSNTIASKLNSYFSEITTQK